MCKQLDQTMYVSQHASKPDGTAETAPVVPESVTPPPIANPKLVLQQPLAPPARRATARRRDRCAGQAGSSPLGPAQGACSPPPMPRPLTPLAVLGGSRRPGRAPPDPNACTAARTRAALLALLSPFTRAVLPLADGSSRPVGEPKDCALWASVSASRV